MSCLARPPKLWRIFMHSLHQFREHRGGLVEGISLPRGEMIERFLGTGDEPPLCFGAHPKPTGTEIQLSYCVGVDWIECGEHALYVEPKLNADGVPQTDYLGMLFSALKHPDLINQTHDLFEIRFDDVPIEIEQQNDLLTPLLVVQFLQVVRTIVRKGLKRSYYPVEKNYSATIKGKILVAKTVKHNITKHRQIDTVCRHEEFGFNGLENRLLKKTLGFVQRYLPCVRDLNAAVALKAVFGYIRPAFEDISEEVADHELRQTPANVFYREYSEGIRLAKLILKRFGYNISNAQPRKFITTPPFWIDMSKLFELYVLGLLKDRYQNAVQVQEHVHSGYPDFLLNTESEKFIIDAKYKRVYGGGFDVADVRQLSGYGRDRDTLKKLGYHKDVWSSTVVRCLVIYPDLPILPNRTNGPTTEIALGSKVEISEFEQFFKLPVKLPATCEANPTSY